MTNLTPAYDKWLKETQKETQTTIAQRMLRKNIPLDDIAEFTGLSIETLQKLRPNNSKLSGTSPD